jgi:glycosyltransferase involved in cell wall biosynthesis
MPAATLVRRTSEEGRARRGAGQVAAAERPPRATGSAAVDPDAAGCSCVPSKARDVNNLPPNAVILSFEGPDPYSMVGGLGVRVTNLAAALARAGIATDFFFVGAPDAPAVETRSPRLRLHRWCQTISRRFPAGVYDGEYEKSADFASTAPPAVCAEVVAPARNRGEHVLVFGEDWQIAPAIVRLDADLRRWGLREHATLLWNANNTYGFHAIDWQALVAAARITAVSKYMKFELAQRGVSALVIPNGIPEQLLGEYDSQTVRVLRGGFSADHALLKVGRFDADKRWLQAIDALADLRAERVGVQLIIRGGKESYRDVVLERAQARQLRVAGISVQGGAPAELARALRDVRADVIEIQSFLPEPTLHALYGAVDAVLANSGREPFGLVGLEVMAMHGIPVCGSTGEDYARPFDNAIVCDTDDPRELSSYLKALFRDAGLTEDIRKNGLATAKQYTWPNVLRILGAKLAF